MIFQIFGGKEKRKQGKTRTGVYTKIKWKGGFLILYIYIYTYKTINFWVRIG